MSATDDLAVLRRYKYETGIYDQKIVEHLMRMKFIPMKMEMKILL